ncbi:MAG: tetratricopeptide repeat protein [Flavobacteriales bacterium]|nr:tetratricopeptide repeat protein [Flavobacteriales bacterium]MBP9079944.1 tetratricopeptide repeat protein [Flavobacteriales bacterium]
MATAADPFAPQAPPTLERLVRYAQGTLNPQECHAVELHLEQDPLLREALDGLMIPGALDALRTLRKPPNGRSPLNWPLLMVAVAGVGSLLVWTFTRPMGEIPIRTHAPDSKATPAGSMPAMVDSTLSVVDAELGTLPVEPQATSEPAAERFREDQAPTGPVERTGVERMPAQTPRVEQRPSKPDLLHEHTGRSSRRLLFLHGMKVVHPVELDRSNRDLPSPGRYAKMETARKDSIPAILAERPYLTLIDQALGALDRGDERQALDQLYLVLGQYPEDVNAQFYAGLACYRLGLSTRAQGHLKAAAANSVDSFREEALWYLALTTEHMAGPTAAHPLFERIAREGGFYAPQAQERLQHPR